MKTIYSSATENQDNLAQMKSFNERDFMEKYLSSTALTWNFEDDLSFILDLLEQIKTFSDDEKIIFFAKLYGYTGEEIAKYFNSKLEQINTRFRDILYYLDLKQTCRKMYIEPGRPIKNRMGNRKP